jgi:hypothetical protein
VTGAATGFTDLDLAFEPIPWALLTIMDDSTMAESLIMEVGGLDSSMLRA